MLVSTCFDRFCFSIFCITVGPVFAFSDFDVTCLTGLILGRTVFSCVTERFGFELVALPSTALFF